MNNFLSISENIFFQSPPVYGIESQKPIILCDFDGTISLKDVTDILLTHFGKDGCEDLEEQWLAGVIGSQECMSKQIALMDATLDELDNVLAQVEIDPDFKAFVNKALDEDIVVHVVSDGLDYAIQSVLKRHNLGTLPVFANRLLHDNKRSWRLDFPYASTGCVKASGNCKCAHLQKQQQHFNNVLYVGDGTSDYCVSHKVDLVFAKDKLISYCQQHSINHYKIRNFADALDVLPRVLAQPSYNNVNSRQHTIAAMSVE
ncbi:MtnX-like HAD-IB family phosphatase [Entomomonas asaccharolytica]|uniref:MtnX-like HAD-IB family phosphatase n=1 Tax=Entomomonas asaccharolytica TaxID=2785331 RepID=A0A974RVP5_9GAMM|nr:MtnX-like HAD-IB family phosphatase [Entomomonas asaccharolytica]QQP84305.1 MtnX-like HAD-IB family phosphatase [Entomomonas asaccharolytica]